MSETAQFRNKMMSDGYFMAENIVSEEKIGSVLESIFKIYCKYNPSTKLLKLEKPWHTKLFHEEMIKFRELEPKKFSLLYNTAQTSVSLLGLLNDETITKYCANLLGSKSTELSIAEGMVRMDCPLDEKNIAGWHQEIAYLGNNGVVVWVPLSDITVELGPLQLCPKSHLEGDLLDSKNMKKNYSWYRSSINSSSKSNDEVKPVDSSYDKIEQEKIEKYSVIHAEMKKGDALFFDTKTFHRSGINSSDMIRFSCATRFANFTEEDFVPFRETKTYDKFFLNQSGRAGVKGLPTY